MRCIAPTNCNNLCLNKDLPYLPAQKNTQQPKIADEIVHIWRNMIPPGRFLTRLQNADTQLNNDGDSTRGRWMDVGDTRAKKKTCQCLRGEYMMILAPRGRQIRCATIDVLPTHLSAGMVSSKKKSDDRGNAQRRKQRQNTPAMLPNE